MCWTDLLRDPHVFAQHWDAELMITKQASERIMEQKNLLERV